MLDRSFKNYKLIFRQPDNEKAEEESYTSEIFEVGRRFYLNHIGIPNVIDRFLSISQFYKSIEFVDEQDDFMINGGKKIMPAYLDMILEEIENVLENDQITPDRNAKSIQKFPDVPFFIIPNYCISF
jgi:hypothetical protein